MTKDVYTYSCLDCGYRANELKPICRECEPDLRNIVKTLVSRGKAIISKGKTSKGKPITHNVKYPLPEGCKIKFGLSGKLGAKKYAILKRDNFRCNYCGSTKSLGIDHIFPRSKGGGNAYHNLQVLCTKCDSRKGDKLPDDATLKRLNKVVSPYLEPTNFTY